MKLHGLGYMALAAALAGGSPTGVALGTAVVASMAVTTTAQPAAAAASKHKKKKHARHARSRRGYGDRYGYSGGTRNIIPQGMYTGYPPWARDAFAPKL